LIELIILWSGLFAVFAGSSGIFYAYLKRCAAKPWKLNIDRNFAPDVSIIVPTHDEEEVIKAKLENIKEASYPKDKMEIIVADDASNDTTVKRVEEFIEENQHLNIKILKGNPRVGKAGVLNRALEATKNDVIIVSDADSFWPSDTLVKSLPYLSDPTVGAITGLGMLNNPYQSWITRIESNYLRLTSAMRIGESKIHSTIRFEGGFCAYKRKAFEKFDAESGADDSGTALEIVQRNHRTIAVPEAIFFTAFPPRLLDRFKVKARRANHLVCLWAKGLKYLIKNRLFLPKRIAVPEIMLFIFDPVIFFALIVTAMTTILLFPISLFSLIVLLFIGALLLFVRRIFFEVLLDNLVLLYALTAFLLGRRYISWEKT
jgi:biofilm PGA synthesis N-glycosyltransferase PgaC